MNDKEMLLIAYGALKSTEEANAYIVGLIERHLAVEADITKREEMAKKKGTEDSRRETF